MTKRMLGVVLLAWLFGLAGSPTSEAGRFRRLSYAPERQYLEGAIVGEDRVSYYIVGMDGQEKCYDKRSIEVLSQNAEEDAAILARFGYGLEALKTYERALAAATSEAHRAALNEKIIALAPMLKETAVLEMLAARYPESGVVRYWLGRALMSERRYPEASRRMQEAAELEPRALEYRVGLAEARLWMAHEALLSQRPDEARAILSEIPYSARVDEAVRWLARDDFRARLDQAGSAALLEYDPYLFIGRYLVDSRHFVLAGPYLLAASERHPRDPVVHNYLAHVFLDHGRVADAEAEMAWGDGNPANHPPDAERLERLLESWRKHESQRAALEEQRRVASRRQEEQRRQVESAKPAEPPKEPPLQPGEIRITGPD
ncbi:hypothetical protein HS125_03285 [bacterium]|nr:hypothetical protein [bacterium]